VPTFIYKALHDMPYTVYLGHKRTFEYVEDICKTLANIADNFKPGEVYNVGGDVQYHIKHLSDIILRLLGKDERQVHYKDAEPFTTVAKIGDSSKAKRDLRHNCITTLEVGIQRTLAWMQDLYKIQTQPPVAIAQ